MQRCDVRGYIETCRRGEVYEVLMRETGLDRDDQKAEFMAAVFGAPGYSRRTVTGRVMRRKWPGLMRQIDRLYDKNNPTVLNRMAQRLEREVMIDGAIGAFVRENPGVPVLPMHDALVVPAGYRDAAEGCIVSAWQIRFGLAPQIKSEPWSE